MFAAPVQIGLALLVLTLALCTQPAAAQRPAHALSEEHTEVRLGESPVVIVIHQSEAPGPTYISLHDDENTAVRAAQAMIHRQGGRLVEIRHTGARNVSFVLGGTSYTFDPNRMFTDRGATASLKKLGPFSGGALTEVRHFARRLLEVVDLQSLDRVVTMHNNTEGHYSAASYAAGGTYEREAAAVYLPPEADADDFFFVTTRRLYDALAGGPHPVVLQDNARMTDDGSLSVYCGQRGIAYVNVEAQHGHRKEQVRMLEYLAEELKTP